MPQRLTIMRGDLGGLLEVVRRARRDLVEEQLLGRAAAHQRDRGARAGRTRRAGRCPPATRRSRRAPRRARTGEISSTRRVSPWTLPQIAWPTSWAAMIARSRSFIERRRPVPTATFSQPACRSSLRDLVAAASRGHDRRLVEQVGQLGAGEAVRLARQQLDVDVVRQWLAARVDLEDRLAAGDVGQADVHLAAEAAGSQDRLVEDVEAVRRGDDDDRPSRCRSRRARRAAG